ncbi:serine hydrolase [Paenibacillus filicis]|uniref:Serine hydrolase n=1 Tax=Paenibacillus filicis TaxID=669464 RepID=A0ABU9DCA6_9BACL
MLNIPTDIPEYHRLSSKALLEFFTRMEQLKLEVNSFMLLQDGHATAQFWREPYRKDSPQLLYSLSKSFTSIAIGIAWDQGWLDLEDPVISFFPDKLPATISPNLANMTVHHLLSMNTGHQENIYAAVVSEQDWVKAFLAQEVEHEPGSHYRYSTPATYMLSAIIERVTGQNLVDFLMPRLFEPLGIPRPSWETCPMGVTAGGMGLSLTTESVAKFGLMLLQRGIFEGKRMVSERYIKLATMEQSDNRAGAKRIDSAQGYGYQFHLGRRGCYRGDGSFGQLCLVAPEEQIVIVANSSFKSMEPLQTLLNLIYEHIFDRLDEEVTPCSEAYMELQNRLSTLTPIIPANQTVPDPIPMVHPGRYHMDDNPQGLRTIGLEVHEETWELHVCYGDDRDHRVPFHFTQPMRTKQVFNKDLSLHLQEVVTYASWQDHRTIQLTMFYIETPYVVTYTLILQGKTLCFRFNINVSFNLSEYTVRGHLRKDDYLWESR